MKARVARAVFQALPAIVLTAWVSGCSRETPATPVPSPAAEIRGAPIRAAAVAPQPVTNGPAGPIETVTPRDGVASTAPSNAPSAVVAAVDDPAAGTPEKPLSIGFDRLAGFVYEMPDDGAPTTPAATPAAESQIPAVIRALDKKFVSLKGFMLPLKVEGGLVTEMLIMRDQSMCCFGSVPKINEWVSVKMGSKGVKPVMDQAITFFGLLRVGEQRENGYLVGIYQMEGDRVATEFVP